MARRKSKPEIGSGAETAEEDCHSRFRGMLRESAEHQMRGRDSNMLTEADFAAAWRTMFTRRSQPTWKLVLSEAAILVSGVALAYGVQLIGNSSTAVAGGVVVVSSLLGATLAWCLKYARH